MKLYTLCFTGPRGRKWNLTPVDMESKSLQHQIHTSIQSNSGIMSRDWDWVFDLDTLEGSIYAGMRVVGTIKAEYVETLEVQA